ncbi:MAG: ribonuclease P protein component [Phycisphaerae bacterium]
MSAAEPTPPRLTLPRACRLSRDAEFAHAMRGVRVSADKLTLRVAHNGMSITRFGLRVGRVVGPAVERNRIKRCLREAFRHCRARLPHGLDIVMVPQRGMGVELASVVNCLEGLVAQAARRLQASGRS